MSDKIRWMTLVVILITLGMPFPAQSEPLRLVDLASSNTVSGDAALSKLKDRRLVIVGELHNHAEHHRAQLRVIQALYDAGLHLAIGLEMFRSDSQAFLDQWVSGQMDEVRFKPVFLDNWNYDWLLYRPIFEYSQAAKIPLVGLNVSRKITAQVAYKGFESLTKEEKGPLEGITCDVTPEYRDFIQRAYGAHGQNTMTFERFCEAQLVWDTAMAMQAVDYVRKHSQVTLVILAGSGHARKLGIPTQLEKLGWQSYAVILPETKGIFDAFLLSEQDADYLLIGY